jgi:hypothetical protein
MEIAMRSWFLFMAMAALGTALAAQPTPGLSIDIVVHEPSTDQVGPYIAGIQDPNPNYDPLQPTGEPQFISVYGNGKGYHNELDRVSDELYAIGGTTTHDLVILTNNTGSDITINTNAFGGQGFDLGLTRAKGQPLTTQEAGTPDPAASHQIYPYEQNSILVPNGGSVPVFLFRTKWRNQLDTSPREYIFPFLFEDQGGQPFEVEADLLVPPVGGSNPTGCASSPGGFPHGLWIIAGGAMAAYTTRRKLLKKART